MATHKSCVSPFNFAKDYSDARENVLTLLGFVEAKEKREMGTD